MPITDTLSNISDTLTGITTNFEGNPAPVSEVRELTDKDLRKRRIIRIVAVLVIISAVAVLIYIIKKRKK